MHILKIQMALLGLFFLSGSISRQQKINIKFDVFFRGEKIGMLNARQTTVGAQTFEELSSETEADVLFFSFHLESDVTVTKENGVLVKGTAYRKSNHGPDDVQAMIVKAGSQYNREQNGVMDKISIPEITFCVIDLYFEEPKRVKKIFSNMYTQMLELKKVGPGKYQLITPDENNPVYIYHSGTLVRVELNTKLGDVISKRNSPLN